MPRGDRMSAATETERAAGEEGLAAYRFILTVLAYAVPFVFILLPLILFLIQSFYYVEDGNIVHQLTLRNYERFFAGRGFVPVFFNTILLCLGVAAITVLFGYPIAYLLASLRGRRKYVMMVIFVVPLVMWLIKKDDSPFVDDHGRETLNFHISLYLYAGAALALSLMTCGIAAIVVPGLYILGIVGMIAASKAARRGEYYRYHMTMRFL